MAKIYWGSRLSDATFQGVLFYLNPIPSVNNPIVAILKAIELLHNVVCFVGGKIILTALYSTANSTQLWTIGIT